MVAQKPPAMGLASSASWACSNPSTLRAGGRLCLATWQPLAANDWLTIPEAVLMRYATLPEAADGPGMFAQSDPAALTTAGFDAVQSSR
jgi:hypothetical protein